MFKKGGSANEGIMHGLVDRRKYANSNAADLFQSLSGSPDTYPYGISFKDANVTEPIMGGAVGGYEWPKNLLKSMDPQEQNIKALTEKIAELPYVPGAKPNIAGTPIVADPQPKVKKSTGDIDGIDRNQLQQIIADKKEGLSDKAKKYAELLSPHAMKRATTDALIAASEAGQTSTGNTFQDLTNMLTAAAKGSGGARDTLDQANLLALQEEIQTNVARASAKPNTTESAIAFYQKTGMSDTDIVQMMSKNTLQITDFLGKGTTNKSDYKNWARYKEGENEKFGGFLPEKKDGSIDDDLVNTSIDSDKFYWDQENLAWVGKNKEGKIQKVNPKNY